MMMVAAVGEQVAGIPGALIAALAFFLPPGLLTFGVGRLWRRLANWPWRLVDPEQGLAPVAIGLAVAGLLTFGRTSVTGWVTGGIALAVFFATIYTKVNPGNPDSLRSGRGRHRAAMICAVRFSDTS